MQGMFAKWKILVFVGLVGVLFLAGGCSDSDSEDDIIPSSLSGTWYYRFNVNISTGKADLYGVQRLLALRSDGTWAMYIFSSSAGNGEEAFASGAAKIESGGDEPDTLYLYVNYSMDDSWLESLFAYAIDEVSSSHIHMNNGSLEYTLTRKIANRNPLYGLLWESSNGTILADTDVTVSRTNEDPILLTTNEFGMFVVGGESPGNVTVTAAPDGCEEKSISVEIVSGTSTFVSLQVDSLETTAEYTGIREVVDPLGLHLP